MATVALVNASRGTALAVRAALGGLRGFHGAEAADFVECSADAIPAGAALVVVEWPVDEATLLGGLAATNAPVLLLAAGRTRSLPSLGNRRSTIVKNPCEPVVLRAALRELLEMPGSAATVAVEAVPAPGERWLEAPLVPASVTPLLAAAARLGGPLWIVGEPGSGADRVAAALLRARGDDAEALRWPFDDSLASVAESARPVIVAGLDHLDAHGLGSVEQFLAFEPRGLVVLVSGDDPDAAVAEGRLPLSLYRRLSGAALRLPPLRERGDAATLASAIAGDVARRAFGATACTFDDAALAALAAYPWPGNYDELEAVVTRSVLAATRRDADGVTLGEADLRFALDLGRGLDIGARPASAADFGQPAVPAAAAEDVGAGTARRAVVLELDAARAARPSGEASTSDGQMLAAAELSAEASSASAAAIEAVLASLAHDLNNPMVTVRTFATLAAASADGDSGELARQAAADADRIATHLAFLQRFAELPAGGAAGTNSETTDGPGRAASRIDAFELLGDAIEAADATSAAEVSARTPLWWQADTDLARFVADAIVAECAERRAGGRPADGPASVQSEPASVDLAADRRGVEVRLPLGGAAVDRLGKFLGGSALPWRLALAREAARRAGGDLELHVNDEEMRLLWRAPVVEEASHDEQAGRADRRRRSRGS